MKFGWSIPPLRPQPCIAGNLFFSPGVGHQPPAPRLAGAGAADQRHQANLLRPQSLHCLLAHVEEMLSQEERSVSGRVGRHEVLERLDVEHLVGLELLKLGELDTHLQSRLPQFLKRRTSTTPDLEILLPRPESSLMRQTQLAWRPPPPSSAS